MITAEQPGKDQIAVQLSSQVSIVLISPAIHLNSRCTALSLVFYTLSQKDLLINSTNLKTDFRFFLLVDSAVYVQPHLKATLPFLPREIQKIKLSKRLTHSTD